VRLLPELAATLKRPTGSLAPEQERRLVFAAVARLLANVAGRAGTLLVLDDLQWAGQDALDLLATLVRGAGAPLAIVGAYRDTEVRPADPLGLLLGDLAQARLARQHHLGPLSPEEAAAMLDHLLADGAGGDRPVPGQVLARAGGHPFFLVSYAQALRQGSTQGIPWDVAQGVRQRVALLPAAGQEIVGVATIVGRQVSRAVLLAVAGLPLGEALGGLEAACRARLLVEEGEDGYAFAHDVIREVVEADLGAARRAALHGKVAEVLEGAPLGVLPVLLAHHFTYGGDQAKAVRYLELAVDHAWGERAYAAAESQYGEVLDRLERLGRVQDAARVREKLGEVLVRTGRHTAALEALEPAAESYRAAGDLEGLGRTTASIGEAHALRGTLNEGMARLRPVLEQLGRDETSPALAALHFWRGVFLITAGRYDESLAVLERAAELARAGGDDRTLVQVAWNRASTLQLLGRLEEALRADQEVLPLAEALGDLQSVMSVHRNIGYFYAL
jgi:predicted ATPase